MPLTAKGEKIKSALEGEYGKERGERILYAGKNKGTFTGIDAVATRSDKLTAIADACRTLADGVSEMEGRMDRRADRDL